MKFDLLGSKVQKDRRSFREDTHVKAAVGTSAWHRALLIPMLAA
jgi:hypothetical protein